MSKKYTTHILVGFLIFFIGMYIIYLIKLENLHDAIEYHGKIIKTKVDQKGYPFFMIKGYSKWITIPQAIGSDYQVGDSLSKEEGKSTIKLFRNEKLISQYY